MPQIRPYTQQLSPEPTIPNQQAQASDFGGPGTIAVGKALQSVGQDLSYVQHFRQQAAAQQETANAQVLTSEMHTDALQDLLDSEAKWKPGDPPIAEAYAARWQQRFAEQGDQFQTAAGQQHYQTRAAAITSQLVIESSRAQSNLHGQAVKAQVETWKDKEGNFLLQHPAYAPMKIEDAAKTVGTVATAYNLKSGPTTKMVRETQEALAVNGVQGLINTIPNRALEILKNPDLAKDAQYGWITQYVPQNKLDALMASAQTAVNAVDIEARRAETDALRQKKAQYDATDRQFGEQFALWRENPGNAKFKPLTATRVAEALRNDEIDGPTGRTWLNMIDETARRGPLTTHTNPIVEHRLFKGIHDGTITDTVPIYNEYLKGNLNDTTRNDLRKELVESRSPEGSVEGKEVADFLKGIEPQITKPGPLGFYADPSTPEKFFAYKQELKRTIQQYKKDGKDWRPLLDPDSPLYFGKVAKSAKYQSTGFGSLQQAAETPPRPPDAPPRKSLDDIFGTKK